MKSAKLTALFIFGATVFGVSAQGVWLEQKHDFGAFDEALGTVRCDFRLVNTGTEPIAIINVRANCGCTKPEYSRDPIEPGDTATISVGFDPTGRPGRFVKYINIDLDSNPKRSSLTIQGTVIGTANTLKSRFPISFGPMRLRSKIIAYGDVYKTHSGSQFLEGYNASPDTIHPIVTDCPRYIDVTVEPQAVPPGDRFIISTIIDGRKIKGWGLVTDSMTIAPNHGYPEKITVETVAIVGEDFTNLSAQERENAPIIDTDITAIDLERISRNSKPIKRSFTIYNRGKSPLLIRRISCPDEAIDIKLETTKIKAGKKAKAIVTVTPERLGDSRLLNSRINIIANDPDHQSTMVRVVAEIK